MRPFFVLGLVACSGPGTPVPPPNNPANHGGEAIDRDTDDDGILDAHDRCPDQVEDYDTFADDDGCPDPDNDGDGTLDEADDCPYDPGPIPDRGCVPPCRVIVTSSDDCFLDPSVFYDRRDVPQPARIAEIVALIKGNPSVQGLEVLGTRTELVATPLRAQLPGIEIVENRRDTGVERAIYVRITKQRFDEGRFRTMDCTPFGPIYRPARPDNCSR